MSGWLSQHRLALRAAFAKLAAQGVAGVLNMLVIGIALSLPTMGYVLLEGVQRLAQRFSLEPQVSVFLDQGTAAANRDAIEKRLKAEPGVASFRFVPREEALSRLRNAEGMAEVVAALDRNPLPDAFVLRLREGQAERLEGMAADLRRLPGVALVQADSAWAKRLSALVETGRLGIALLGTLLAVGLVAVTFNTIRLQVLTQSEEIEVAKLLGATDAFIRRPFYYLGALQGLAGGVIGLALLAGGLAVLNEGVRQLATTYGSDFALTFPPPGDALAVGLFAAVLGWVGAYLSVSVYLRGIEPK